jgi:hypothetical protein
VPFETETISVPVIDVSPHVSPAAGATVIVHVPVGLHAAAASDPPPHPANPTRNNPAIPKHVFNFIPPSR